LRSIRPKSSMCNRADEFRKEHEMCIKHLGVVFGAILLAFCIASGLLASTPRLVADSSVVGGCGVPCTLNSASNDCSVSKCRPRKHNCVGDGSNVCIPAVYCNEGESPCGTETQEILSDCVAS